jgi:hypothetical protein
LLLAVVPAGRNVAEYIAGWDPVSGSVYLSMLVAFAELPWLHHPRRDDPYGNPVPFVAQA